MITVTKILNRVYILKDRCGCCANLIIGKERALLFDTGCGVDDMFEAVRTITNLPLLVIASHGHYDHIGGSHQFEKVYFSQEDRIILDYYDNDVLNKWIREIKEENEVTSMQMEHSIDFGCPYWSKLQELNFDSFDLGNLICEVIPLQGHTKGSIGIYIPNLKLLLSGDALTPIMCLNFLNHMSKEDQYNTLKKVQKLGFDIYLTSHHDKKFPKLLISRMIECIEQSYGRRHHSYQYPRPPYTKGWFYLYSIEEEPIGIIVSNQENDLKV